MMGKGLQAIQDLVSGEGGIQGTPSHSDFGVPFPSVHKALILQRLT